MRISNLKHISLKLTGLLPFLSLLVTTQLSACKSSSFLLIVSPKYENDRDETTKPLHKAINSPHYSLCIPKVFLLLQALRTRTMFDAFFTHCFYRHCQLSASSSFHMAGTRFTPLSHMITFSIFSLLRCVYYKVRFNKAICRRFSPVMSYQ